MAASNVIAFEHHCPACGRSAPIRARSHIAAAFAGDEAGRFCDRTYGIGDLMAWFPPGDVRHSAWAAGGRALAGSVQEACRATCGRCGAVLCAVIRYRALRVVEVSQLSLEEDWPRGFPR
jgi:hypothetical protein